ncbi:hypothetical protein [Granulibacter bethesdensis]|uniref:hypothetical protein n=1 Tax=Granulibacter bethesdensis TaxID=364410 RepID=UPI00090A5792|nr:hypothetical protein [Granulibacter bethesdensis]APH58610.1 putative secreted protein [Granulibacter bethesdensis]
MKPVFTAGLVATVLCIPSFTGAFAASPSEQTTISATHQENYTAAPMPNLDVGEPNKPVQPAKPYVSATLYQPRDEFRGDGYTWKDSSQVVMERNLQPTPTMLVKVPLHGDDN